MSTFSSNPEKKQVYLVLYGDSHRIFRTRERAAEYKAFLEQSHTKVTIHANFVFK